MKVTVPGLQLQVLVSVRGIILPGVCMGVCNGGGFPSIHMEIEALELGFWKQSSLQATRLWTWG